LWARGFSASRAVRQAARQPVVEEKIINKAIEADFFPRISEPVKEKPRIERSA
jgi:hypothetical protein